MDKKHVTTNTVHVNQEVMIEELVDVELIGTEAFDNDTLEAYDISRDTMQNRYYSLCNSSFEVTADQNNDAE